MYNDYYPFGMLLPNRHASSASYRYGFQGQEKDDEIKGEGNSYNFGMRMYDSRVGRFLSIDPLHSKNPSWAPYSYAIDNPIMYVDVNGEWPGITFFYFEMDVGVGLGYGLNYVEQSGMAYDEIGKTHFTQVSALYVVNQNLEEGSKNPQLVIAASAGLAGWVSQNWEHNTFAEYAEGSASGYGLPAGDWSAKAEFGLGVGINSESLSVGFGPQIGFKISVIGTNITSSISLTDNQADEINDATDIFNENWIVNNPRYNAKTDKWQASVATKNTKGELIDTGIQIYSSNSTDEKGNISSDGIWQSSMYEIKNEVIQNNENDED